MMILKVDNVGVDNELTMLMLTVDVDDCSSDGETSKRFCTERAAFDSLFRKELRSQTLPILCLCILRQKFESGFKSFVE